MTYHRRLCLAVLTPELDKVGITEDRRDRLARSYLRYGDRGASFFFDQTKPDATLPVYRDRTSLLYYLCRFSPKLSYRYESNREGLHQKHRHLSCDPGWISEKYGGGDFSPLRVQDDSGYWRRWQAYWINEIIHEKMFVQTWVRGQHSMSLTQDWIDPLRQKQSVQ